MCIFKKLIYAFLAMLGLRCCEGFSSFGGRGQSPGVVCGLLSAVASLVAEPGLSGTGSPAVVRGLSCSVAWDLPELGIEPISPALAGEFSTTEP